MDRQKLAMEVGNLLLLNLELASVLDEQNAKIADLEKKLASARDGLPEPESSPVDPAETPRTPKS